MVSLKKWEHVHTRDTSELGKHGSLQPPHSHQGPGHWVSLSMSPQPARLAWHRQTHSRALLKSSPSFLALPSSLLISEPESGGMGEGPRLGAQCPQLQRGPDKWLCPSWAASWPQGTAEDEQGGPSLRPHTVLWLWTPAAAGPAFWPTA